MDHSVNEGRGLTHALTDTPPTDLTVATHSPLGAQPRSDRIRCAYCAAGWRQPLPTCTCSMPSSARAAAPACRLPWALVRKHTPQAAARVPVVKTGECGDVWRHVPGPIVMAQDMPAELRYGIVAMPSRKRFQMWAQFRSYPNPLLASGCACAGCARTLRVLFVRVYGAFPVVR